MNKQDGSVGIVVIALIVVAILVVPVLVYRHLKLNSIHKETFTIQKITDRDLQVISGGESKPSPYAGLIYTDKGVYRNVDSTFPWKTRSSDLYNQLKTGKKYTCEIAGWRNGFFSKYKNIIDCDGFRYY